MRRKVDACTAQIEAVTGQIEAELSEHRGTEGCPGPVERLATIPGVSTLLTQVIIAEVGLDMARFPTPGHSPHGRGCVRVTTSRPAGGGRGAPGTALSTSRAALGQAAITAARAKNTYLSARYRRLVGHTGRKRAIVAVGHKILIAAWHVLHDAVYRELGADYYDGRLSDARKTRRAVDELHRLGYQVTLTPQNA